MADGTEVVPESARNLRSLGHSDQGGRGDGVQVMINKGFAYVAHVFSGGFTVIDVRDPRNPKTVNFIAAPPNTWSIHLQSFGDLLLVINEFDFYSEYQNESTYYGGSTNDTGDRPFTAGIRVFDIKDPARPRDIGFMAVEGKGVHRIWWDGGQYAYASVLATGFTDHIFSVVDLNDPVHPYEVGRWWVPGMWSAGGEEPSWTNGRWALHHAVVADDIAYCGWRDGGLILLDVSDPTQPSLVGARTWFPQLGGGMHSGLPLADKGLCLVPDEAIADQCADGLKRIWVVNVEIPSNPVTISTFPVPNERDYLAKGGHFGPHNVHENRKESFQSSDLIFATYQNAGVRVVDLRDPFAPREVGHFVPPPPTAWTDYRPNRPRVIHTADVYVSREGIVYITDFCGGGLHILEYEGFSQA